MKTTDNFLDAPDKPPTFFVFGIVVVTFLFVFAAWFVVYPLLSQFTYKMQNELDTGMSNKTRLSYIEEQNKFLKSSGPHKISIDQAMDEVIQKANRPLGNEDAARREERRVQQRSAARAAWSMERHDGGTQAMSNNAASSFPRGLNEF